MEQTKTESQIFALADEAAPRCMTRRLMDSNKAFTPKLAAGVLISLSLDFHEKLRVIDAELSDFQVRALIDVFEEEQGKFVELAKEHPHDCAALTAKAVFTNCMLMRHLGLDLPDKLEDALCRRMVRAIRKRFGKVMQDFLEDETNWEKRQRIYSWFWRHAMPGHHISWSLAEGRRASEHLVPDAI